MSNKKSRKELATQIFKPLRNEKICLLKSILD